MRRREFIAGLGGALAGPIAASGQPKTVPMVGFVHGGAGVVDERYAADFGKLIADDTEKSAKVIKFAGIKAD
jgi:hypothetical protein